MDGDTWYHFFSYGRQGLAAAIDRDADDGQKRADIDLCVDMSCRAKGTGTPLRPELKVNVQLYGPGDVVGFDERIVVRTDPVHDSGNFEANSFPVIEFADFDFPWRYSPKKAEEKGLTPWIVLIVLIGEDRGEDIRREYEVLTRDSQQLPAVRVFNRANLPDLNYAWRWAHVQATSGQQSFTEDPQDFISEQPSCVVSRLICPRRLQPNTLYTAFVVPAYKLGHAAGLDTPAAWDEARSCSASALAWDISSHDPIDLPYYYRWEFRTGVRDEFEYLVRKLEARNLEGLGLREIDCGHPGYGLSVERSDLTDPEKKHCLDMEGALQSLSTEYTPWGRDPAGSASGQTNTTAETFRKRLAEEVLNKGDADRAQLEVSEDFDPTHALLDLSFDFFPDGKTVRVCWETDAQTTGRIEYGQGASVGGQYSKPDRPFYPYFGISDSPATVHEVVITLIPERTYHFRLRIFTLDTGAEVLTGDATIRMPLPAVVPPIYGRWHAACRKVDSDADGWIHVLNLDPRHRAAAGLGAEVIRKNQEALMASAWEQLGEIEKANDILRRAQAGRECSNALYNGLKSMALEDFLRCTAPVQKVIRSRTRNKEKTTVATELASRMKIPAGALDPAFRRTARPRGPIRKRQERFGKSGRRTDMLRRIAGGEIMPAGPHPKPEGMVSPYKITEEMLKNYPPGGAVAAKNAGVSGSVKAQYPSAFRFSDDSISVSQFDTALAALKSEESEAYVSDGLAEAVHDAFTKLLFTEAAKVSQGQSNQSQDFADTRDGLLAELDPRKTIVARTQALLQPTERLARRFAEDAQGDPLDEIMAYPEFPQPMYEPLLQLSESHILPGVEKVPQNTIGQLKTNGRFLESYMVGLNHAFAAELLWRRYPTDQRGSSFRQFWDVDESVCEQPEDIRPLHEWGTTPLGDNDNRSLFNGGENLVLLIRGDLLNRYPGTVIYAVNARLEKGVDGKWTEGFVPDLDEYAGSMIEPAPAAVQPRAQRKSAGASSATPPPPDPGDGEPISPIFRGSLGTDLVFLGFPFSSADALSSDQSTGKFFIFEGRITATRFGLDLTDQLDAEIPIGSYLDNSSTVNSVNGVAWNNDTSAAQAADIILQKPVRLAVHADQMIPNVGS